MKQPIDKMTLCELVKRVALGDNSKNGEIKERYELDEHQRNLLNTIYRLARTKLFNQVKIEKL